jgi:ABC-type Co2+ transport system permease subunit
MSDYDYPTPSGRLGHATNWGLASLIMGCTLAITAVLMLLVILQGFQHILFMRWRPADIEVGRKWGQVIMGVVIGFAGLGLLLGLNGLLSPRSWGQPRGLAIAGIFVCALSGFLWWGDLYLYGEAMKDLAKLLSQPRFQFE